MAALVVISFPAPGIALGQAQAQPAATHAPARGTVIDRCSAPTLGRQGRRRQSLGATSRPPCWCPSLLPVIPSESIAAGPGMTYVIVDGENLDATLGLSILENRPAPE